MDKKYNEGSVHTLAALEGIRTRLSMYIGGNDNIALHHVVKEIISNSIDEHLSGYGSEIKIDIDEQENSVTISDYGRGIPHGSIAEVFTQLHSSAKIKSKNKEAYGSSGGLHGVGLKTATATGKIFVKSNRDSVQHAQKFHYELIEQPVVKKTQEKNGTSIKYTPDEDVFTDSKIKYSVVKELLIGMSYLLPDMKFLLSCGNEREIIKGRGIDEYIKDTYSSIVSPIMNIEESNDLFKLKISMAWTQDRTEEYTSFVNMIPNENGGTHITAFKSTMTRLYNKKYEANLSGTELRQGLKVILSLQMEDEPVFKGQDKSSLNMNSINTDLNEMYRDGLESVFSENDDFFSKLNEMIEKQRKKERAMDKVREMLSETKESKKIGNAALGKLKPAINKKNLELYIVEGDSASGNLVKERNKYHQAIMPLRGKVINSVKNDLEKVLANNEVKDLIKVIGGFGENFKTESCAYNKIFLCLDADPDGVHIQMLLLTFFMKFYPQLVRDGRIYIAQTPLYVIKKGVKKEFIHSEEEMSKKRSSIPKSATVSRIKGLGELNADILSSAVLKEETRVLRQVTIDDYDSTMQKIEEYMNTDGAVRRQIVEEAENGK